MMDFLMNPWPWWFSGILVGLTPALLFLLAGKFFGISTSLQEIGAVCSPNSRLDYFKNFDRRGNLWTLVFVVGLVLGGYVATHFLSASRPEFLPAAFDGWGGTARLFVGGILVGFGARYANGCTSGHAITGISNLSWSSLVATVCFILGGVTLTWTLGPMLFGSVN